MNRAEAAMELAEAGQGESYKEDAYTCINVIRERAGATLLGNVAETTMEIVRTERRKELGFENKTWWDMKRWRTLDREQNNRIYRILMPFYADKAGNGSLMLGMMKRIPAIQWIPVGIIWIYQ